MTNLVDKTCLSTDWWTPERILAPCREALGCTRFATDPATHPSNPTGAEWIYTGPTGHQDYDGLLNEWVGPWFVNPPFGSGLKDWVEAIAENAGELERGIALLPGQRFETGYVQDHLLTHPRLTWICFVRRRIRFLHAVEDEDGQVHTTEGRSNTYGSMLWCFGEVNPEPLRALGVVWRPMALSYTGG